MSERANDGQPVSERSPASERSFAFEVTSVVPATAAAVWRRVSTMAGVNDELMPLVRMTHPRGMESLDGTDVPLGEKLFRSWILLFGVVPVDYDDLTLLRVTPGEGFSESSPMLSQRRWSHERVLEDVPGGCRVTDRIAFVPRMAWLGSVYLPIFRAFFHHRHRRLRRFFQSIASAG
jgi:hypothetical protein